MSPQTRFLTKSLGLSRSDQRAAQSITTGLAGYLESVTAVTAAAQASPAAAGVEKFGPPEEKHGV